MSNASPKIAATSGPITQNVLAGAFFGTQASVLIPLVKGTKYRFWSFTGVLKNDDSVPSTITVSQAGFVLVVTQAGGAVTPGSWFVPGDLGGITLPTVLAPTTVFNLGCAAPTLDSEPLEITGEDFFGGTLTISAFFNLNNGAAAAHNFDTTLTVIYDTVPEV